MHTAHATPTSTDDPERAPSTRAHRLNQDVRDVIAEFAVSSVQGAGALRTVSRAWRLSVDRRVRDLVAYGRPELRPSITDGPHPSHLNARGTTLPPLVLDTDETSEALDALRWTLRRDKSRAIVRLAIISR